MRKLISVLYVRYWPYSRFIFLWMIQILEYPQCSEDVHDDISILVVNGYNVRLLLHAFLLRTNLPHFTLKLGATDITSLSFFFSGFCMSCPKMKSVLDIVSHPHKSSCCMLHTLLSLMVFWPLICEGVSVFEGTSDGERSKHISFPSCSGASSIQLQNGDEMSSSQLYLGSP